MAGPRRVSRQFAPAYQRCLLVTVTRGWLNTWLVLILALSVFIFKVKHAQHKFSPPKKIQESLD